MNFYTLPLIINDRREIITQLNKDILYFDEKTYIIETNDGQTFNLLSFNKDLILKSFVPDTEDIALKDLELECQIQGGHIVIILMPKAHKEEKELTAKEQDAPLNYDDLEAFEAQEKFLENASAPSEKAKYSFIGTLSKDLKIYCKISAHGSVHILAVVPQNLKEICESQIGNINITLEFHHERHVFKSKTHLSLAYPEQFLGIALDFGSESSQMAVKRYLNTASIQDKRPQVENLFQNILSYHTAKGWVENNQNESYYQEEVNTNYYKSIFFLKADLSGEYDDIDQESFIKNGQEDLKMLVNTHDGFTTLSQQRFHQLPNLKITHRHNDLFSKINFNIQKSGYDINISLGDLKSKIYNSILKVIIDSFLKKEFLRYEHAKRKIRFILLVPNIYDFNDIHQTQLLLNTIFSEFAENEYAGKILAWEIATISESDASLLGYVNKNNSGIRNNKDYVIVDAGKGTTDLSIIRTGKKNVYNIQPIYRNGFAGAGNLITYAIFETILHHIRANSTNENSAFHFIRDKIIAVLNGKDLERKNQFYQELERLKFNYKESTPAIKAQWQNAKTGDIQFRNLTEAGTDISSLTDLLRNIENIGDFYGYVQQTCHMISERVVSNVRLIQENKEDFDCGGILLTGRGFLFEPLAREVRNKIKSQLNVSLDKVELLQGNELKDVCVKGVFNHSIRMNSEKVGYPIQIVYTQKGNEEEEQPKEKSGEGFQSRMLRLFFNDLNNLEKAEKIIASDKNLSLKSLFQSQIMIGANRYKIVGNSIYEDDLEHTLEADIVFTPQGYLVREKRNGKVVHIFPLFEIFDSEETELSMVIPSLFPNYIDDRFLYSLKRDDIRKAPIIPDAPKTEPTPTPENKGPIYF